MKYLICYELSFDGGNVHGDAVFELDSMRNDDLNKCRELIIKHNTENNPDLTGFRNVVIRSIFKLDQ